MSVDVGRKQVIQASLTQKLVEKLDEVAEREAKDGDKPNRSKVIRRYVAEGLAREGIYECK